MRVDNKIASMVVDASNGKLKLENKTFADHVQQAKERWWYELFEKKFLGEDETKKSN